MQQLEARVQAALEGAGVTRDAPLLVGVSGGPDSLCLLESVHSLGFKVIVAHFNHGLRPESDTEAHAVEEHSRRLSLPFLLGQADVREEARRGGASIEAAARDCRYGFLFREARRVGAQAVAVGHTADDQAETVLMHLLRGAGIRGLSGMAYRTLLQSFDPSIPLMRPLLGTWRDDVLAYCEARGLHPAHDASNDSTVFLRNRLRRNLMPVLEEYNPRIRTVLWRMAEGMARDRELLDELSRFDYEKTILRESSDYVALDARRLQECSAAGARHVLRRALERMAPTENITHLQIARAQEFLGHPARRLARLAGGIGIVREGGTIYVSRGAAPLPFDAWPQLPAGRDSLPVVIPGEVALANGWEFGARGPVERTEAAERAEDQPDRFRAILDASRLPTRCELRSRRNGDRFKPLGLRGHSQKLSDFFINEKVPARARARWPLLCAGDVIVWIPGFRPADDFRIAPDTRRQTEFFVWKSA